ncbi:vacuolar protein sorting-associated protein 33A [Chrysoperla carnea]|uniref:vacuolar protein sorting-associated protein 33A n=1 Tax=Chrysoperla carnea TaxID=189513 RepID=UPI001D071294|nr:vacuolar protein sorting-associated protein 33A [Chrysoperla carnea]
MSHLQGGRVNVGLLQQQARKELLRLLEKCEGPKAIVWDESLAGPVGLTAKYSLLKEHNAGVMFPLRAGALPPTTAKHVIFITRPKLQLMDLISENIQSEKRNITRQGREYHLIFVPSFSSVCEKHLQHRGVFGSFASIDNYPCFLFPMDSDVISMELSGSFKDYQLDRDPTCLFQAAQALMALQRLYGPIGYIWGVGHAADTVWSLTKRLSLESNEMRNIGSSSIDQLILIDRAIDLVSPLATQLTYEGLIDEIFSINNTTAQFPIDKFVSDENSPPPTGPKQIILNSADELYADLRDKNFNAVGPALKKQAKLISSQFEERHGEKTVQEIKQFVAKLPNMLASKQALATHTAIAECIKEVTDTSDFLDTIHTEQEFMNCMDTDKICPFIEELIANKAPLVKVLRLICLQCATGSGLKYKVMEYYKRELVQVYGIQTLLTINNLEKAGLLYVQSTSRSYTSLRKSLHLTMEDTSEVDPTDISYVHSIYAPLSVRIVENIFKPRGLKHLQDFLGLLPGPSFEDTQPTAYFGGHVRRNSMSSEISQYDTPKMVLIFYIGGCTFAEISALRFLTQQDDTNYEFLIATTKLINGNSFINSFQYNIPAAATS